MKSKKVRRRMPPLSRVPLPRQTGGAHRAAKGGKYDRDVFRRDMRREIKEGD